MNGPLPLVALVLQSAPNLRF